MVRFDGRYTLSSWTRSVDYAERRSRSSINIRVNGTLFSVVLGADYFENSPLRSLELRNVLENLHGSDWLDEDTETDSGVFITSPGRFPSTGQSIDEAIEWAITPYLETFESLSPPPAKNTLTLADMYPNDGFFCTLRSNNDQLVLGDVQKYRTPVYRHSLFPDIMDSGTISREEQHNAHWTTTFPCFRPDEVEVCNEAWDLTRNMNRIFTYSVRVPGSDQRLYYKRFRQEDEGKGEVLKYEQIGREDLRLDVLILRPVGVVRDESGNPRGILLPFIPSAKMLQSRLLTQHSSKVEQRWIRQIETTVTALHSRGIVWGSAGPTNIVIDGDDDAWVVDFGDKRRMGRDDDLSWDTVEADLQGLQKIRECIQSMST